MLWGIRFVLVAGLVAASVILWAVLVIGLGGDCVAPICGPLQKVWVFA